MLKQTIKDRVFRAAEESGTAVRSLWDELTLANPQSVFFDWIE
jgi:hypothetical protein